MLGQSANKAPGYASHPKHRVDLSQPKERVRVTFHGEVIADSVRPIKVEETNHDPVYYLPQADVRMDRLVRSNHSSHCPFKGDASYWTISVNDWAAQNAVWSYQQPFDEAAGLRGHMAFYPDRVDEISVTPGI